MRYGVIDIGSNTVKFLVAEKVGADVCVLTQQSHPTRLAEDLIATAELKAEAMARTLELFAALRAEGEKLGVGKWMAVATSAVRDAKNRKVFLKAATEQLKFPVRVLSGEEEAETIYLGIMGDPTLRGLDILAVDVGGGSAEWIQGQEGAIEKRLSLPLGCVRLRERFITGYPVPADTLSGMLKAVEEQLQPVLKGFKLGSRLLIGTGGTITASASLIKGLKDFSPEKIHLFAISRAILQDKFHELGRMSLDQLAHQTGLPASRADIIVPGMAVFITSMQLLGAHEIRVSTRGLRYGVLQRLLKDG